MVNNITKMSQNSQNKFLRVFARVDIDTKLQILKEQKVIFHRIKNDYDLSNEILTLASLILAIQNIVNRLDNTKLNVIKLKNHIIYHKQSKRDKLLGYWSIVLKLKENENFSFRQIAKYLTKYHKFEVAHSTIFNLYYELKNNNKGEKEDG